MDVATDISKSLLDRAILWGEHSNNLGLAHAVTNDYLLPRYVFSGFVNLNALIFRFSVRTRQNFAISGFQLQSKGVVGIGIIRNAEELLRGGEPHIRSVEQKRPGIVGCFEGLL